MSAAPKRIVVLGGGTAGWMAANLFAARWPTHTVHTALIESPDIGTVGVGEGSTPALKRFFDLIGVSDAQWMPECGATYKLGIRFDGWSPESGIDSYAHPFFSKVDTFTQHALTVNCKTRRLGLDVHTRPDDFFLNALLATQRKGPQVPEQFPFEVDYGYHFDSGLLGQWLAQHARARGVMHVRANVTNVVRSDTGDIAALMTSDGTRVDGDVFVDCSGFAAVLMDGALGVGFTDFSDNLFNDAAVVVATDADTNPVPETRATALEAGWAWRIPLAHRTGNGYVYSSAHSTPEQAERELRRHTQCAADADARHLQMRVGQRARHWSHNCIALGLSQGFLEPLEATALLLVQVSVESFMQAWEAGDFSAARRDEYNAHLSERFERARDYIVAHYKLNTRTDSDYWRANRDNTILSDNVRHLFDVWYRKGDLGAEIAQRKAATHFGSLSWHCLFAGYGAFPPLASDQPGIGDHYLDQDVARFLNRCSMNFSSHAQNLQHAASTG
ncbi:MAG: tryptophan halogenase family protein [Pseudomonadota bacterium]